MSRFTTTQVAARARRRTATTALALAFPLLGASNAHAAEPCGTNGVRTASGETITCTYTLAGAEDTFTVPSGITRLSVTAIGARGGGQYFGLGAVVSNPSLPVQAGANLYVFPGSAGQTLQQVSSSGCGPVSGTGGLPDGGNHGAAVRSVCVTNSDRLAGGGGGSSAVSTAPRATAALTGKATTDSRLLVAGGGGGGTGFSFLPGGDAGNPLIVGASTPPGNNAKAPDAGVGPTDGTDGGGTNGHVISAGKGTASAGNDGFYAPQAGGAIQAAGAGGGGGWFGGGGGNATAGGGGLAAGAGSSYAGADPTGTATVRKATTGESPQITISFDGVAPSTTDDVPSGWQKSPVTVTLTASDGGSGVKSTTYEILAPDGTPGATKTYDSANKPVLGTGEKIRYRSVDNAGNTEGDHTSAAAKVDGQAPTTGDNVSTNWTNANVTVTLTAADPGGSGIDRTTYEILPFGVGSPTPTQTYDPANKPVLGDRDRIRYRSIDVAGNVEADHTSLEAKVDLQSPTTVAVFITGWRKTPVTVTLSALDLKSGIDKTTYEILDAGGAPGPTTTYNAAAPPTLGNGEKLRFRSIDNAGNVEANQTTLAAQVDDQAPTTTDDVPSAWQKSPVTVTLTAADTGGSGLDATTYEILAADGTPGATKTYDAANKPVLSDGEKIRYRSVDVAGNAEADHTGAAVKVDGQAPTTTDNVPAAWAKANVTVTLTAVDTGGSGLDATTYEILAADGTPGATKTYDAANKPVLSDGEKIRYRSVDTAGNVEADHTSRAAKVDTAAPSTTDDVPAGWQKSPVTVTLTAADTGGSGVDATTYEILAADGTPGPTKTYDAANRPVLSDGEKIRYRSVDTAGNVEADHTSRAAKVDTAAPSTTDDVPAGWQKSPVTVTLTAADTGGSGVDATTYEILAADGTPGATKTYDAANRPVLSDGEKIRYRSVDTAGNVEADHTSAAVKVDGQAPTTTDDVPSAWQKSPVTVTLTAVDTGGSGLDATTYEILAADGTPGATKTYDAANRPVLSDGEKIRYRSVDTAGNVEADHTSRAAKVDTAAPSTTDSLPAGWQKSPVTVTLTAADTGGSGVDATTYEILAADGTPGATKTYDAANKPVLSDGEKIRYRSIDTAGNAEGDHTSAAAKVDTQVPTTSDDVPTTRTAAPVTVTLTAADTGGSGLEKTTYELVSAGGTTGPTKTYDPASKPVLQAGESIVYRSRDVAGNVETDRRGGPLSTPTPVPTPTPTASPAPAGTPAPTVVPQAESTTSRVTLRLELFGPQIWLSKHYVLVRVGCGPVACRMTVAGELWAKGKRRVTLRTRTVRLAAKEMRILRLPTTRSQRRAIRRIVGPRGSNGEARFALSATDLDTRPTPPNTSGTLTVELRRVGQPRTAR